MKRMKGIGLLTLALLAAEPGAVAASTRTTPAIESRYQQALAAIEADQSIRAVQLLQYLTNLPEHVYSERAQELLGNVREDNGQLAHAVAEYQAYLRKYPDGEGAGRVQARLNGILGGAAPTQANPAPPAPRTASGPSPSENRAASATPSRPSFGRGAGGTAPEDGSAPAAAPMARTVTESGSVTAYYRYNEGSVEYTELNPDPIPNIEEDEDDVFASTLTTSLRYRRVVEDADSKFTLAFSGSYRHDFEDDDDNQFRTREAYGKYEFKDSGTALTFGRHRLRPAGIAYRLDGLSAAIPSQNGPTVGLFVGNAVDSTRDDLFSSDTVLFGASATFEDLLGDGGDLSVYYAQEELGSYTDRQALGIELETSRGDTTFFANGEYDLQLEELNRILFTTSHVFADRSRLTARLAQYRSPGLSLSNALIGQTADSLEVLDDSYTQSEIEDLAIDRTAKVTTFGLTYSTELTETWRMSAYASLYDTTGKPASGGVAAVDDEGVRSYAGLRFTGTSIFKDRDSLSFGLRFSNSDDNDYYLASAAMRYPVNDKLTLRPRVRVGYRDQSDGHETTVAPSINLRYKIDDRTDFQAEVGYQFSKTETTTLEQERNETFVTLGLTRRF